MRLIGALCWGDGVRALLVRLVSFYLGGDFGGFAGVESGRYWGFKCFL